MDPINPGEQDYFVDKGITGCPVREINGLPSTLSRKKSKRTWCTLIRTAWPPFSFFFSCRESD